MIFSTFNVVCLFDKVDGRIPYNMLTKMDVSISDCFLRELH